MRDDNLAGDVVRPVADPLAKRQPLRKRVPHALITETAPPRPRRRKYAVPPVAR
jgi:hypothetical protein